MLLHHPHHIISRTIGCVDSLRKYEVPHWRWAYIYMINYSVYMFANPIDESKLSKAYAKA